MFAIIDYKGVQLKVCEDKEYNIPLFECKEGDKIKFGQVILLSKDGKTEIGTPYLDGAYVDAEVSLIGQTPKETIIKFKAKKRYKKIGSHRQDFVTVKIKKIAIK